MKKGFLFGSIIAFALITFYSCKSKKKDDTKVVVWELADPETLNPPLYNDAASGFIIKSLFLQLLDLDFKSLEIVPVLAESKPLIEKRSDGTGLNITYRIRPEARWDDGSHITAKDVEFTLKVIKAPKVNNPQMKPYYEFISDFIFDPNDSLKFTIVSNKVYMTAEVSSGDYYIIPQKNYDPKNLLAGFTVKQINDEGDKLANDPRIIEFANEFNSPKFQREPNYVVGCGAYRLKEWKTGQQVILEKKENWWGDALTDKTTLFEAYPKTIIHQIITDQTTAVTALKSGVLDVMGSIKSKDFMELANSEKFNKNYNRYSPPRLSYEFFGINCKDPKFADTTTRVALAHLIDVERMIKDIRYGLATQIIGPIHPSKRKEYDSTIMPYTYDPTLAKELLAKAGWKDSDGNGLLDKNLNGKKTDFTIDFIYNSGNEERKAAMLLFQEEARKVGIKVNILALDWSVYLENCKKHKFDMYYGAWVSAPVPNDFKQVYHTESYTSEGSNFNGFGNAVSDALIDSIRVELDESKRIQMYKRFQKMCHNAAVYLYILAPSERIAVHKRFENVYPSALRPGYWECGFKQSPN